MELFRVHLVYLGLLLLDPWLEDGLKTLLQLKDLLDLLESAPVIIKHRGCAIHLFKCLVLERLYVGEEPVSVAGILQGR